MATRWRKGRVGRRPSRDLKELSYGIPWSRKKLVLEVVSAGGSCIAFTDVCDSGAGEEQSSLRSLGQGRRTRLLLPASDTGAQKGASVWDHRGPYSRSPVSRTMPFSLVPFPFPSFTPPRLWRHQDSLFLCVFLKLFYAKSSFFTQILAFFLSMTFFPQLNYISSTSFYVSIVWVLFLVFISCVILWYMEA